MQASDFGLIASVGGLLEGFEGFFLRGGGWGVEILGFCSWGFRGSQGSTDPHSPELLSLGLWIWDGLRVARVPPTPPPSEFLDIPELAVIFLSALSAPCFPKP